jgi:hypothetical protein
MMGQRLWLAATPSSLGQRSTACIHTYVEPGTERERYWKNNAPVLGKLDWNSMTFLLPRIARTTLNQLKSNKPSTNAPYKQSQPTKHNGKTRWKC